MALLPNTIYLKRRSARFAFLTRRTLVVAVFAFLLLTYVLSPRRILRRDAHPLNHLAFWDDVHDALSSCDPSAASPIKDSAGATWPARYVAHMSVDDVRLLKRAHTNYVRKTKEMTLAGIYQPHTAGIVTTAGGRYLQVLLVSLRMLRKTGSTLPVEVFLATDEEFDEHFCENLLPELDARCRVISHSFGTKLVTQLESFQLKVFAILASSYEDVLFLDADNLALMKPEHIFQSPMYRRNGMIVWPDFLETSASPILAQVQGREVRWTNAAGLSMEAGQMFISKRVHQQTLLLSLFYNYYGPRYFYPLFTQGGNGEGDKETFAAAAAFHGLPYHRVEKRVQGFGFFDSDDVFEMKDLDHFKNVGMAQFVPDALPSVKGAAAAFLHWNLPKLDALSFTHEDAWLGQRERGNRHRLWQYVRTDQETFVPWSESELSSLASFWGDDPEAAVFEKMLHVACVDMRAQSGMEQACQELRSHHRAVYSTY